MTHELFKDQPLILIVDDITENMKIIGSILKVEKYRIIVATDGVKAIELATTQNPDLILLDIQMPGIDGYEVCKGLKNNQATAGIPVIFLSAYNEPAYISMGFEAGGDDFITKPFQAKEVIARVETHLSLKFSLQKLKELNDTGNKSEEKFTPDLNYLHFRKIGFANWLIKTFATY